MTKCVLFREVLPGQRFAYSPKSKHVTEKGIKVNSTPIETNGRVFGNAVIFSTQSLDYGCVIQIDPKTSVLINE
jgi:hypothetical protein